MGLDAESGYTVLDALKGEVPVGDAVLKTELCDLLSSDITLSSSGLEEVRREHRESILRDMLDPIIKDYDYVVIDTPPALNLLTVNAYAVSDYLIIPMASDILSLVGLSQLRETVETVKGQLNPDLKVMGILLTRYNRHTCGQRCAGNGRSAGNADEHAGLCVQNPKWSCHRRSTCSWGKYFSYNPRSAAVKDYSEFVQEVARIIGL